MLQDFFDYLHEMALSQNQPESTLLSSTDVKTMKHHLELFALALVSSCYDNGYIIAAIEIEEP